MLTVVVKAQDFWTKCESGQTLYYKIIDKTNNYVAIVYPGYDVRNIHGMVLQHLPAKSSFLKPLKIKALHIRLWGYTGALSIIVKR